MFKRNVEIPTAQIPLLVPRFPGTCSNFALDHQHTSFQRRIYAYRQKLHFNTEVYTAKTEHALETTSIQGLYGHCSFMVVPTAFTPVLIETKSS